MPAFRKRTYVTAFRPSAGMRKRSRFTRKRRFTKRTGGKRTTDFTSLNTRGHAIGFRGKKTSRRTFNKHIWNSTIFKPHYRSVLTQDLNLSTPATLTDGTIQLFNMYQFGGVGFGTAAGGAREIDLGAGVPTFEESSFILRGGKYELTIANLSTSDLKMKLWRITTGNNPDLSVVPASEDWGWDPSVTPDFFNQVGKPWMSREVIINGNDQYTFSTRFKTQKIDGEAYINNARSPYLCILVSSQDGGGVANFKAIQSYNLSFSADAI
ncbi:MAG: putative capsid protein [Cressdnaviricota sp.]|nr:MAG: putative capsid protein [Cressdnaviricota sp.]